MRIQHILYVLVLLLFVACKKDDQEEVSNFSVNHIDNQADAQILTGESSKKWALTSYLINGDDASKYFGCTIDSLEYEFFSTDKLLITKSCTDDRGVSEESYSLEDGNLTIKGKTYDVLELTGSLLKIEKFDVISATIYVNGVAAGTQETDAFLELEFKPI